MNKNLKSFLLMGIPFGICMGLLQASEHGASAGLTKGITSGIFFGGSMTLVLGFLQRRSVRNVSPGNSADAMDVHQVRKLELRLPFDQAFDLCIESLGEIKRGKVRSQERSAGKIVAKTGMTWKTWGDTITFDLRKTGDDSVQIEVSSRPALRMTMYDYGKNLENVEALVGFLNAQGVNRE